MNFVITGRPLVHFNIADNGIVAFKNIKFLHFNVKIAGAFMVVTVGIPVDKKFSVTYSFNYVSTTPMHYFNTQTPTQLHTPARQPFFRMV